MGPRACFGPQARQEWSRGDRPRARSGSIFDVLLERPGRAQYPRHLRPLLLTGAPLGERVRTPCQAPSAKSQSSAAVDPERPLFDQSFDILQCFLDRLNAGMVGAESAPLGVPDRILEELDVSVGTFADEVSGSARWWWAHSLLAAPRAALRRARCDSAQRLWHRAEG
jgi:hypothetical protein